MINVEDHAAHCRMAKEIIIILIVNTFNNSGSVLVCSRGSRSSRSSGSRSSLTSLQLQW